jgi:hypothetical protein
MQIHDMVTMPSPQELTPLFQMHAELCKALAN